MPGDLARVDAGTIVGVWRETSRDGRGVSSGYYLTIGHSLTFAVQKGCVVTGGVLEPAGQDRYRIQRYDTGFETPGCGPWKAGPEVAPFDGAEVRLSRQGDRLFVEGGGLAAQLGRLGTRSTK